MAKGGKRSGAGRKPGSKDKLALTIDFVRERIEKATAAGLTPLEYLLLVMRDDKNETALRVEAAGKAAPFIHRKQPQDVELKATMPGIVQFITPLTTP